MKKSYLRLVRRTFRALRHRRLRHRPWWRTLTRPIFHRSLWVPCRDTVANGLAIGLFFSMLLLVPFQTIWAAIVAMRLKANVPFAMAACWISNALTSVPIAMAQYRLGEWVRNSVDLHLPHTIAYAELKIPGLGILNASSFALGSLISGTVLALCAYPLVHLFSAILPHHLPVRSLRADRRPRPHCRLESDAP